MIEKKLLASQDLSDQEIVELAEQLLSNEEGLDESAELLCHSASVLFHYGIKQQKGHPLLLAINKLMHAEEINPEIFEETIEWRHLWGNILVHLSRLVHDFNFVEKALEQYAQAARICKEQNGGLFWDWAQAWLLLGVQSVEHADLKQGLDKFITAVSLGCDSPLFRIDLAIAHMICGMHVGDPSFLEGALSILKGVIADTYDPDGEVTQVHGRAWMTYAMVCKQRFTLTHLQNDFEEADTAFREAILTLPSQADLWLEWGDLYLYVGWLRRDLKAIEVGLDKLTSSKVKEGDPLRVSALLGKGLVILGLYLEDLKLLGEGKERIMAALEIAEDHPELLNGAALSEFAEGMYFSNTQRFAKAATYFEEGIEADPTSVRSWHGLFQTYLSWGMCEDDPALTQRGVDAIARVCGLRPYSPIHLNEWGVCLLQQRQLEWDLDVSQALIEEAILRFKQAYALQEEAETLYNLGCAHDHLGDLSGNEEDYEKAIEFLSEVYESNPEEPHVCYHLALALSHLGELEGSVDSLSRAIEIFEPLADADSDDATLWGDLGYALLNLSELIYDSLNPEKGEELRRKAEKRLLHAAEVGNCDANYHLACLYSLAGLVEASMLFLKRSEGEEALPPKEDLAYDEWLTNVRETDLFKEFIAND